MITPAEILEHYQVIRQTFAPLRLSRWQLMRLLASQLWREASPVAKTVGVAAVLLLLVSIVAWMTRPPSLRRLGIPPAIKSKSGRLDFKEVLEDTAKMRPDTPFYLNAFGTEYVVMPSKCFDEVKRLPEKNASGFAYFYQVFHGAWTGAGVQTPELGKTIAVELTRAIPSLVQWRQQDCAAAFNMAVGACPDWREIKLYPTMQDMVASVNASAIVGRELGTDQKWIRAVDRMPMGVAIPTIILGYLPALLRPITKPFLFLPLKLIRWKIKRMLRPVLERDIREYECSADKKDLFGPKEQGKVQLTGWLLARYKGKMDFDALVQDYITLSFESTPSTASTLFFLVCELAADPTLQDLLRQELQEQTEDGRLPQTHLNELRKMDSVMRESARVNPFSYLVLYRKLRAPTKLSLGPELPAGTNICVDAHHINNSPTLWDRPDVFDGLRHYRARQTPQNENRFKFANLGSDAPGWGDGLQACPGRMFADNTIKIILTHLLLHYDVRLRPGEAKPKKGPCRTGPSCRIWEPGFCSGQDRRLPGWPQTRNMFSAGAAVFSSNNTQIMVGSQLLRSV
ncbi:cytochrome P450 oxidoreductase GliF [Colletotrichum higginsianum]|nr:cytochrome P450 oxidoreductase GliF [Colletotrichum higginsianum]